MIFAGFGGIFGKKPGVCGIKKAPVPPMGREHPCSVVPPMFSAPEAGRPLVPQVGGARRDFGAQAPYTPAGRAVFGTVRCRDAFSRGVPLWRQVRVPTPAPSSRNMDIMAFPEGKVNGVGRKIRPLRTWPWGRSPARPGRPARGPGSGPRQWRRWWPRGCSFGHRNAGGR